MKDQITIVGNVGADPEMRRLADGSVVASLRVASQDRRLDTKSGEWVDGTTSWYDVSAFRGLGENVLASIRRGQRVIVTGGLTIRRWESGDKAGTSAEIVASAIGPELKFGTTAFTARQSARQAGPASADAEPTSQPGEDRAAAWAAEPADTPF
ncbi:single-stranded DNA-binding protein [Microbacterium sp.]|uniref:single-stranded DNA-binding protein n=1 Tax=Microbacterium sp. TaxID=51671 RepID=UPI003736A431